jgi:WD40 repeat protein
MRSKLFFVQVFISACLLPLALSACLQVQGGVVSTETPLSLATENGSTESSSTATPSSSVQPLPIGTNVAAFVKDGNIQVWDDATQQTRTIVDSGDVIAVTMSDDGKVIAYLRRSEVQVAENEWFEQSALWAVDRNGGNPRELVSAQSLRQRLNAAEGDSTNIPQMQWIPGTHRLLYNGWKYLVQAEGESHAIPEGLFLIDADSLTATELVPAGNALRFEISPDGQQVALITPEGLSYINVDGSNFRQNVLTYPGAGVPTPIFPVGVWTQDSSAFVITGFSEQTTADDINLTIWRVPVDGSAPEALADIQRSHPDSVTFSPDGKYMAFIQATESQPSEIAGWFIAPLTPEPGPLAIPNKIGFEQYANVQWSPAGDPFTSNLQKLCPNAASDKDICDARIHFGGNTVAIQWIDGNSVLFLSRDPSVLFWGKMDFTVNQDGTTIPIAAWPVEDWVSPKSFTAVKISP